MPESLHLLSPGWLLLLLPAAALLWLLWRRPGERGAWSRVVDARLQPLLLGAGQGRRQVRAIGLLALAWLLGVLALANPAWERSPQPLLASGASRVVVLELSRSMLADDIRPSRLVRARLKVEDLIDSESAGQTGLVAYAGDAFTVTPLTRDADTLRSLLRVLEPGIMPVRGSRLDLALAQAHRLLRQSGVERGEVIVIADSADAAASREAAELAGAGHRVSVLGVGVPGSTGGSRAVGFDAAALKAIAAAGAGRFATLSDDAGDIDALLRGYTDWSVDPTDDDAQAQAWQGRGPLLALLLVPLAALAFRRGWLMAWVAAAVVYLPAPPAVASAWDDLWSRPDQQAARALADGDYGRAADVATDPLVRGAAVYRQGDFQAALAAYRESGDAEGAYNAGNALAMLGQYRAAVEAYDRALALEPTMEDAEFNKRLIEGLLAERDQESPATDRPQAQDQAEPESSQGDAEPESSQADAEQQSADADDASSSEGGSPSDAGNQGGEVASQSDTEQADDDTGEQDGSETAQAAQSGGDEDEETADASADPDEQVAGDQSSGEPGTGQEQASAQSQGAEAGASVEQGGVESGDQVTQAGEQDAAGAGQSADASAEQPGQEDEAADRTQGTERPSPDTIDEEGHMASAEDDRSGDAPDDTASREPDRSDRQQQDRQQPGQGQPDDRPATEIGQTFAEANRRLAERQDEGAEGEGDLPEPAASSPGSDPDANAPPGRRPGDDPREQMGDLAAGSDWSTEERLAAEQWLRRIPDDPGGLLRRKFLHQYRERQRSMGRNQPR